jgi:hypothetical protein
LELFAGDINVQQIFAIKTGYRIVVRNQSSEPVPIDMGIDVATGQQTNIAISRKFYNKLSEPFSNCVTNLDDKTIRKNSHLK